MKITYTDKVSLVTSPLPDENKVTDGDMNEIKSATNYNDDSLPPIASGYEYFGTTAPNSHYMIADGTAISREDYSELYAIIGTTYGDGDGATTFNLPDLRRRYPLMKGADDTLGTTGGSEELFAKVNPTSGGMNYQNSGRSFTTNYRTTGTGAKEASSQSNSNGGIDVVGKTDTSTSREPYIIVNYIIRVK